MKKKLLAALLVLVMLLSVMPLAAYANDDDAGAGTSESGEEADSNQTDGDTDTGEDDEDENGNSNSADADTDDGTADDGTTNDDATGDGEDADVNTASNEAATCTHYGYYTYEDNEDGTHTATCTNCGYTQIEEHAHWKTDGPSNECWACGYVCDHTDSTILTYYTTELGHELRCTWCQDLVEGSYELHTYGDDGSCIVCGFTPCNGEHTFGEYGFSKHICTNCGYLSSCIDENENCICDICELDCHYLYGSNWEYNENVHWYTCNRCGEIIENAHIDAGNGVCAICGYIIDENAGNDSGTGTSGSGTTTGSESWDSGHTHIDENGDCVCDICGGAWHVGHWVNGDWGAISTEKADGFDDTSYYKDVGCLFVCDVCGKEIWLNHHDNDGDGLCDRCGAEMDESTDTDDGSANTDDSGLDDVPKTGDASLALAGLSVLFTVCPILKKFVI